MPVSLAVQFKVELTMRTAPVVELTHAVTAVDRVADPTVTVAAPEMVETAVDVAVMVADPVAEGVNIPAEVIVPSVADQVTEES
ncbi:MAG: hypothetical protein ACLQGT_06595 [Terracidiphilus sp.]